MRIVFMGTPDFSVLALTALKEAGHEICGVVTQPDKPKGRGKEIQMTPVKKKALELCIPVYQPRKVRDPEFIKVLEEMAPDAIVVAAFGQILPKEVLELPLYGCINIHASLLPKYRGAAPIQWCLLDGEKETGVTTMQMEEGLDTGAMLEKVLVPIEEKETGGSLHDKLSSAGASLILSTLKKLEAGDITPIPQTEEGTCYAGMIKKSLGNIDWSRSAVAIERLIRGLNPWPSAYTVWNGKTIKIWEAEVLSENDLKAGGKNKVPGQVVVSDRHSLIVAAGEGFLSVTEIQMEGKKRMDVEAFLRGYPVLEGDILTRKESD